ncbi:MAG: hypothetical protein JSW03_01315 [Candidatus Eiseniibacteriota bacterium]|nr:MAG: hypothetical protein JSW03_01315 [Candidatus Eisenbacteria bacterium]
MKTPVKGKRGRSGRKGREVEAHRIGFSARSYWLFAAGFASIIVGYVMLSRGSITLAPVLLVAGYCALIPLAIFVR